MEDVAVDIPNGVLVIAPASTARREICDSVNRITPDNSDKKRLQNPGALSESVVYGENVS